MMTCRTCGAEKRVGTRKIDGDVKPVAYCPRCQSRAVQEWKRRHPEKVRAHHGDYADPLAVVWLCRRHHRDRHPHTRGSDARSKN